MKKQPEKKKRTLIVQTDARTFTVDVDPDVKVTFAPNIPGPRGSNNNMGYALRLYRGTKENLAAVFPDVRWFKEYDLPTSHHYGDFECAGCACKAPQDERPPEGWAYFESTMATVEGNAFKRWSEPVRICAHFCPTCITASEPIVNFHRQILRGATAEKAAAALATPDA